MYIYIIKLASRMITATQRALAGKPEVEFCLLFIKVQLQN